MVTGVDCQDRQRTGHRRPPRCPFRRLLQLVAGQNVVREQLETDKLHAYPEARRPPDPRGKDPAFEMITRRRWITFQHLLHQSAEGFDLRDHPAHTRQPSACPRTPLTAALATSSTIDRLEFGFSPQPIGRNGPMRVIPAKAVEEADLLLPKITDGRRITAPGKCCFNTLASPCSLGAENIRWRRWHPRQWPRYEPSDWQSPCCSRQCAQYGSAPSACTAPKVVLAQFVQNTDAVHHSIRTVHRRCATDASSRMLHNTGSTWPGLHRRASRCIASFGRRTATRTRHPSLGHAPRDVATDEIPIRHKSSPVST